MLNRWRLQARRKVNERGIARGNKWSKYRAEDEQENERDSDERKWVAG
jgi:hypothetical protein